jgi:hypothetical protein
MFHQGSGDGSNESKNNFSSLSFAEINNLLNDITQYQAGLPDVLHKKAEYMSSCNLVFAGCYLSLRALYFHVTGQDNVSGVEAGSAVLLAVALSSTTAEQFYKRWIMAQEELFQSIAIRLNLTIPAFPKSKLLYKAHGDRFLFANEILKPFIEALKAAHSTKEPEESPKSKGCLDCLYRFFRYEQKSTSAKASNHIFPRI